LLGRIAKYIDDQLSSKGALVFALIDSGNHPPETAAQIATKAQVAGCDAILVGGSTAIDQIALNRTVQAIKNNVTVPVILFPGNVTGISPNADAILFTSLLNSDDPYFIIGAQALGSIMVKEHSLEPLATGYIIAGEGGAAGFVGQARRFPPNKPELVALYALAAYYLGMRYVYLEAGSGAESTIPPNTIRAVRKLFDGVLIVGGGIKDEKSARVSIESGADIIVIGNLLETQQFMPTLKTITDIAHERQPGNKNGRLPTTK
jgi:phosphoglycerol geranylgeranyltransferase